MLKRLIALLSIVTIFACSETKKEGNLHIQGEVKGLKKGKLFIQKVVDSTIVNLDTIALNGSSTFESNLQLDSPEMLYLVVDRGQTKNNDDNTLLFFAEPGNIKINTDLEYFLAKSKVTGSKNHELYEEYKDIITQFNDQQLELLTEQIMGTKGNKNYNAEANQAKQDALLKKRYLYAANFAATHADHEVAPYIALTDIVDMQPTFLKEIHKKMTPEVAKSLYGKKFTEFLKDK